MLVLSFHMFYIVAMASMAWAATLEAHDSHSGPSPLLRTEIPVGKLWEAEQLQQEARYAPKDEWNKAMRAKYLNSQVREQDIDYNKCGLLVNTVLDSIKYHLGKRIRADFVSESEAELFAKLKNGQNGVEILTATIRVLGNYTLTEGLMSGSLWTIDDQNKFINCMQNIDQKLEEHQRNEYGDVLVQGDMAVTSTLCRYNEESSKVANDSFPVGLKDCVGLTGCQFKHPDEAVHFCNTQPDCTLIMHKNDGHDCEGGLGCYQPKMGTPFKSTSWEGDGGRTYIKHCPGSLLQMDASESVAVRTNVGVRDAGNRWANGVVPYCFAPGVNDVAQEGFNIAIERVKKQVPCLDFELVAAANETVCAKTPSIMVQSKRSGCWSYVGQVSGKGQKWWDRSQPLNLDRGCEMAGMAMHQLGHALGMGHENSRADRPKVMEVEYKNMGHAQEKQFKTMHDTVKYAWAGSGKCSSRVATTKASMNSSECEKIGGTAGGNSECTLDVCEDGKYMPAPFGRCREKVAQIAIKMQHQDCQRAQGNSTTKGEKWEWTDCHFDLCTDMGLHMAKPLACANKLAYGYIETSGSECSKMGGSSSKNDTTQTNCYMDFCSGELDTPFDWLSLMMYSPYAFSARGEKQTSKPLGNHSAWLSKIMGQRMGFSGDDIFHLGHMYNCWEQIKPDFVESREVSRKMITGQFFEYDAAGGCEDVTPDRTGFDVHGEKGFMKHASCDELKKNCRHTNETIAKYVQAACPVTCLVCMPHFGTTGLQTEDGGMAGDRCFDAGRTGIRFKDGPQALCLDLVNYCHDAAIGAQVRKSCKLSCGGCDAHIVAPFYDTSMECKDGAPEEEPQFTVHGNLTHCPELADYCQHHTDSYLVRHKCLKTCGSCGGPTTTPKVPASNEVFIPGDQGGCSRRRRFGYCSSRRRRNV